MSRDLDPQRRRGAPRNVRVNGTLPGRLIGAAVDSPSTSGAGLEVRATPVDVSRTGIGISTDRPLAPGAGLWLLAEDRAIKLQVRYCVAEGGVYRCGLQSAVAWEDLEGLFLRCGAARPDGDGAGR